MSWAKLCDGYHCHEKTIAASLEANGLYAIALSWVAHRENDGFLPKHVAHSLSRGHIDLCDELVRVGFWEDAGDHYIVRNYLKRNPSAADLAKQRKGWTKRQRALRGRHGVTSNLSLRESSVTPGRDGTGIEASEEPRNKGGAGGSRWRFVPTGEEFTPERRKGASRLGLTGARLDVEWAKFKDHEFDKLKSDVDRAWANWCRKAAGDFAPRAARPRVNELPGRERRAPNGGHAPLPGYDGGGAVVPRNLVAGIGKAMP